MKVANTSRDYAIIMAAEAEKKIQATLTEAIELRGQVKERFEAFKEAVHPRKVTIRDLKDPSKFANSKEADIASTLYRRLNDSTDEIKALNRALGGLVSTDPEFYADEGLLDEILDVEPGRNDKLEKVLQKWDSKMSYYSKRVKGKVGHHPTALSTLREALLGKDQNYRDEFKRIAKEQGYEIGEEVIRYVDPAAHKSFGDKIQGILKEKGIKLKGNEGLFKELQDRMAHAWWAGSTGGTSVSPAATASDDVAKGVALANPNLELDRIGTSSAEQVDALLERFKKMDFGDVNDPEAVKKATNFLTKRLQSTPVPEVEGIWRHGVEVNKGLGVIDNVATKTLQVPQFDPKQPGLITGKRVEKLFGALPQGGDVAALNPNFYQSAVDNVASTADNLLTQVTGLTDTLKMQGIKTAFKTPQELADKLTAKYTTAGAMSMLLDGNFRKAMSEGRFTDAATRLVIEEVVSDKVFQGLQAAYGAAPNTVGALGVVGGAAAVGVLQGTAAQNLSKVTGDVNVLNPNLSSTIAVPIGWRRNPFSDMFNKKNKAKIPVSTLKETNDMWNRLREKGQRWGNFDPVSETNYDD